LLYAGNGALSSIVCQNLGGLACSSLTPQE